MKGWGDIFWLLTNGYLVCSFKAHGFLSGFTAISVVAEGRSNFPLDTGVDIYPFQFSVFHSQCFPQDLFENLLLQSIHGLTSLPCICTCGITKYESPWWKYCCPPAGQSLTFPFTPILPFKLSDLYNRQKNMILLCIQYSASEALGKHHCLLGSRTLYTDMDFFSFFTDT